MKNAMKSLPSNSRLMDTEGNFIAGCVKPIFDCRPAFRKPLADVTPRPSTTFMPYVERPNPDHRADTDNLILAVGSVASLVWGQPLISSIPTRRCNQRCT